MSADSRRTLAGTAVRGVLWSAAAKWSTQIVTWGSTIVVAKLLDKEDFGVMAMSVVFLGIVSIFVDLGIASTAVTLRELSRGQLRQLNSVSGVLGIAGALVAAVSAPLLVLLFDEPRLRGTITVLGITIFLGGLRTVPTACLRRELDWRRLATIESISGVAGAITSIALAWAGFGYWSLVLNQVVISIVSLIALPRRAFIGYEIPDRTSLAPALLFTRRALTGQLSWYVYSNSDFFVAGKRLGVVALGAYSFAWTLVTLPLEKVAQVVNSVLPSIFAAIRGDIDRARRVLYAATELTALVVFPMTVGLAMVAPDLIRVLFGTKWIEAVAPMQALCVYGAVRSIAPALNNALLANHQERLTMWFSIMFAAVFPAAFWWASAYGAMGIALTWSILYPLFLLLQIYLASRTGVIELWPYLRSVVPGTVSVLLMTAILVLWQRSGPDLSGWSAIAADIAVGVVAYTATVIVLFRSSVERILAILKSAKSPPST
ncbi:MAG TPA: lipopolysaccharide biosynthesis protein [Gemmatimonas aurantiaca]|uniref:Lipopolysaccharide biosynthesis protein n=2 Tax=Gemmatimonas aurantiaca TaxID=173480 RepID=A0A3D4VE73_9BACT|nr:lipopolysaccharide biosynthesis protein [Gemmatimonas aurantiaca]BAH37612.1 putative polysaccharide biosynthesis protein [Gemmatimonas aurantiaca T-27]HCT58647.1 lipopolysaccharide biosynthesis protein [Gemmatimonas aurantiaca]